jgi:ATP-binding cassette, subfamily B, bacterial PglK
MKIVNKFLYILSSRERKYAALLLAMMVIMALLEMIGVLSIMPFIAVLANPDLVETNLILKTAYNNSDIIGIKTRKEFIFLLGIIVFLVLIISIVFKFLTNYAQVRFTTGRNYSLAKRLVEGYLHQPYSWFLNRNSADLGKTILADVGMVISRGLNSLLNLIKYSFVTFAIIGILIFVDTKLTIIVGLSLGLSYWFIYSFISKFLLKIGQKRLEAYKWMFTSINEAFGATKEIKVSGLEHAYVKKFSKPARSLASVQALVDLIGQSPRYVLEVIAFGGMMLVALYLMSESANFIEVVPIIALYTLAGYRLIPSLQQIYTSLTSLKFIDPTLDAMYKDLKNLPQINRQSKNEILSCNREIILRNISYYYPNSEKTALKNINFTIPARNITGIVGATGSGKTTTVDIILGLLDIKNGALEVDGKIINKNNLKAWQRSIGYVPQHIFLADDTVTANIAFGIDPKIVDHGAVKRSAKIAKLDEFITNDLSQKYETYIGERGIRLSGGQRQRIGIARALYHNPQVLILDEATSALDNNTEKQVMKEVKNLEKNITIIMIAHRLSTIKECKSILLLDKGELKGQGTFEELIKDNENFRLAASEL